MPGSKKKLLCRKGLFGWKKLRTKVSEMESRVSPVCLPVSPLLGHLGPHNIGYITTAWEYRDRCSCASYTSSSTHLAQVRKEVLCFDCPQRIFQALKLYELLAVLTYKLMAT